MPLKASRDNILPVQFPPEQVVLLLISGNLPHVWTCMVEIRALLKMSQFMPAQAVAPPWLRWHKIVNLELPRLTTSQV